MHHPLIRKNTSVVAVSEYSHGAGIRAPIPTLMRLERGDPTVSMGVWATALWMLDRHHTLADAADPKEDLAALEAEVRQAQQRYRPRRTRRG
jgi:hypothetical protein